jgi:hypothetical protein
VQPRECKSDLRQHLITLRSVESDIARLLEEYTAGYADRLAERRP